tara:strand:+ start:71 stop:1411 length:1341 start_codon:yes stop_codon:yes gene_type:complete
MFSSDLLDLMRSMAKWPTGAALHLAVFLSFCGCVQSESNDGQTNQCDTASPPVVFVHGFLASGDTWNQHTNRFVANGKCRQRFWTFDWNTLDRESDHTTDLLAFIDGVLDTDASAQVDLIGHSAGGGLGYELLSSRAGASVVRRYVHIASFPSDSAAGPPDVSIPMLNIWSPADKIVESADIDGAINIEVPDVDHYRLATSETSFRAIYEFLEDRQPTQLEGRNETEISLSGKYLTFAENQVVPDSRITVYEVDSMTGRRLSDGQDIDVGTGGEWGPISVSSGQNIELVAHHPDPDVPPVRHFRPAPETTESQFYLRTMPDPSSLAGILLAQFHQSTDKTILVVYNASGSFQYGRDSLTLDGEELLDEDTASAENTTIALFIFDLNDDGEDGAISPLFSMFPFLAAIDRSIMADDTQEMSLKHNGRELKMPRDGRGQGIMLAVFDE